MGNQINSAAMEGHLKDNCCMKQKKGTQDSLQHLYDNPLVSHTQLVVATSKNENVMPVAKEVTVRQLQIETVEDNSELAAFTIEAAYMMATLDTKKSTSGTQINRGIEKQRNGSCNKGSTNNNRLSASRNNGSSDNQKTNIREQ